MNGILSNWKASAQQRPSTKWKGNLWIRTIYLNHDAHLTPALGRSYDIRKKSRDESWDRPGPWGERGVGQAFSVASPASLEQAKVVFCGECLLTELRPSEGGGGSPPRWSGKSPGNKVSSWCSFNYPRKMISGSIFKRLHWKLKIRCSCPDWCGSVGWASSCKLKGHQFDPWSRNTPGFGVRSQVRAHVRDTNWYFSHNDVSLPLFLPSSPSL